MRAILAAVVGYLSWTALWLGGNAGLGAAFPDALSAFEAGGALEDRGYLVGALVLSLFCSFAAGKVAAWLGQKRAGTAVWIMAILLLATGIAVQASAWEQMPIWYHLTFLIAIVPVCLWAGKARARAS